VDQERDALSCQFSISWVRALHDGKAWRWHSKSRSAGIASDRHYISLKVKRVKRCGKRFQQVICTINDSRVHVHLLSAN